MRVQRLLATDGIGGYYWRDQEAIGQGAPRDGNEGMGAGHKRVSCAFWRLCGP